MTHADRDTALGNAIMARSLIARHYPQGSDWTVMIDALDGVINVLVKYQPEGAP